LTYLIQTALGIDADGFFGNKTTQAVIDFQKLNILDADGIVGDKTFEQLLTKQHDPRIQVMEMIALMEVSFTKNAWSATSTVSGDGGGLNYGPLQINRGYGSVQTFCKLYLPKGEVFEEYICTGEGAKSMVQYYREQIVAKVIDFTEDFGIMNPEPALIGVIADGSTQGGAPYPSNPIKMESMDEDWPTDALFTAWKPLIIKCYEGVVSTSKVHVAFYNAIQLGVDLGIPFIKAYAELHPRSGTHIWLSDQLSRRRVWSNGSSKVHGTVLSLDMVGL
jgi:hypothetical protein